MGDISELMNMIPGFSGGMGKKIDLDDKKIARFKAIIQSMTLKEREHPEIIKSSRRQRIASGSGTTIQDVNQLLKQFSQTRDLMKSMKGGNMKNMKGMKNMLGGKNFRF